ncbi:MAG TPA: uracil-DNA glycosylase [Planctomycetes bacterium]|nr:uracil-DNA glycosylase [Fuerstiella sp.]HIK94698.1 uracil-DNA glycosylase [Planctomycetota bacterium]
MTDNRALRQFLRLMSASGISHLPTVTLPKLAAAPGKLLAARLKGAAPSTPQPPARNKSASQTQLLSPDRLVPNSAQRPEILESTRSLLEQTFHTAEQQADGLSKLAEAVSACKRCAELADTRRQTVFGVGNPDAEIMFIGEAPGADEDRQGEPFVGAAGKLMDKIIAACGLKREEIYICNILRCRPPGNRNPHPQEAANCREFLDGQIKIVAPKYIVVWGTVAAQNLLGESRPVGRLRGQFLQHGDAKVMCTYHPSYLLRNESAKKLVWEDMKFFMKELGIDLG